MADPKQIVTDIEHLERTGLWPSPIPKWVVEVASEVEAPHYIDPRVVCAGYARAARAAIVQADELRQAYATQCAEHMGTIALASRVSGALQNLVGAEAARQVVEGETAPVYGEPMDVSKAKVDTATDVVTEQIAATVNKIVAELEHFGVSPKELRDALLEMRTANKHFDAVLIAEYDARQTRMRTAANGKVEVVRGGKIVGSQG